VKRDDLAVSRSEHHHVDAPSEYALQLLEREVLAEVEPIACRGGEAHGGQVEHRAHDQSSGLDHSGGRSDARILRWIVATTGQMARRV